MNTDDFLRKITKIKADKIPQHVYTRAAYHVLDTIGVMIAGLNFDNHHQNFYDVLSLQSAPGKSSLLTKKEKLTAPYAAMYNAILSHTIELDDTHSAASLHPGTVIIPAALAVGEEMGSTGREVLYSIIMGYEMTLRLGKALQPEIHYSKGFHPTATCGVFGAAFTASILYGLNVNELRNSISLAGSYTSGNCKYQTEPSLAKRLQPGIAAFNGVMSANLAKHNIYGPKNIFDEYNGFLMSHSSETMNHHLVEGIGNIYEIENTGIKFYPCCRYNHAAIDAVIKIMRTHKIKVENIRKIRVKVTKAAIPIVVQPELIKKQPNTIFDAQFSMYVSVALATIYGEVNIQNFTLEKIKEREVNNIINLVEIVHEPKLDSYYPEYWPVEVTIETNNQRYDTFVKVCSGEPENIDYELIEEKFTSLVETGLTEIQAEEIKDAIINMENENDISRLIKKLNVITNR